VDSQEPRETGIQNFGKIFKILDFFFENYKWKDEKLKKNLGQVWEISKNPKINFWSNYKRNKNFKILKKSRIFNKKNL